MSGAARPLDLLRIGADGSRATIARDIAREVPVALEFDGIGYAVLMATPEDLVDLAYGFALAERLIDRPADIVAVDEHAAEQGLLLRVTLAPGIGARVVDRVRHRVSDSSCGLCGIENLEQALRPLPTLDALCRADDAAVFRAYAALRDHQPLNAATGAVHAAALCSADGQIRLAREDVGRHNAFDKLIGAMLRAGLGWDGGFALLSSRCSYELVEKAVLSGCPLLATISAPTELAVRRAAEAGLPLRVLVRADAQLAVPE
ncbi:formate dehydrogenase accessory sulfurtransferase FdhD [Sphingomonas nostoxanthinifaciens]|uniref:formate dehydrogenase accessory sulfurtransferase FdhD n=1 Tax=Sphingomonas nostoxanthinifaciens TaxID=2872652 RepID=UPI001CC1FBC6|nr:formate dehydrogenase accessory sulfurtransferase FdhD [Sphingomonas nostoxanthinifaciens]UAK26663.1 formate dehydrogenase accessory sulfurtransferase FdhD [Sphingomonas nostoxanthinifaciens]